MSTLHGRAVIILLLALAGVTGATLWRPTAKLADTRPPIELERLFPREFAGWRIEPGPARLVAPDIAAALDKIYSQTLARTYSNDRGDRIMLSVAYGGDQTDATRAHRPEVCYPAQGFQVLSSQNHVLALSGRNLPVRQLVAQQGPRNEPITYWITVGERTTVSGTEQKLAQLSYSLRGVIPDGMLIRVSSIDPDTQSALGKQQQFIEDLLGAVGPTSRSLLIGSGGA